MTGLAGRSNSIWDGPMRLQTFIDAIDVDNFTLDFRGGRETPLIGFGIDVNDPNEFQLRAHSGRQPDGAGRLLHSGQAVAQRDADRHLRSRRRVAGHRYVRAEARRSISRERLSQPELEPRALAGADDSIAHRRDARRHHAPDHAIWTICSVPARRRAGWRSIRRSGATFSTSRIMDFCGVECGANRVQILEEVTSGYLDVVFQQRQRLAHPDPRRHRRALRENGPAGGRLHSRPCAGRRAVPRRSASAIRWIASTATRCRR